MDNFMYYWVPLLAALESEREGRMRERLARGLPLLAHILR